MATKHPILHFGTAVLGSEHVPALQSKQHASELLEIVFKSGISEIDTAARYPPDNHGGSERMLGACEASRMGFNINTKVLFKGSNSDGTLGLEPVRSSVALSLEQLGVEKVGILYAHAPDKTTPLEEQARALSEQLTRGYCRQIGLCNFSPAMVEEFITICENKGYAKPSVYQGQYNLICREPEKGLFPLLRKHNMTFNAFSPLAGGFLTGKLSRGDGEGTRLGSPVGQHYRNWYDKPAFHEALRQLVDAIEPLGMKPTDVALRWICYHSLLGEKDGIILGATKPEQVEENVAQIKKGPLPQEILDHVKILADIIDDEATKTFAV